MSESKVTYLVDKFECKWFPDGRGKYDMEGSTPGYMQGWRRDQIDREWGPVRDELDEDYIRAHGTEYKQRGTTDSGRWFVLGGIAYHSRARGHMERSKWVPGTDAWRLYLVPAKPED